MSYHCYSPLGGWPQHACYSHNPAGRPLHHPSHYLGVPSMHATATILPGGPCIIQATTWEGPACMLSTAMQSRQETWLACMRISVHQPTHTLALKHPHHHNKEP